MAGALVLVKKLISRAPVDRALDRVRLSIDLFPQRGPLARITYSSYQPLPWIGLETGKRAEGSRSRWGAMEPVLDELDGLRTASDIGANFGFFSFSLAERGITTLAVESSPLAYRTALYALRKADIENVGVLVLMVGPTTVELLPQTDVTVLLSVWHHFVRSYGMETADELTREIWARTRRVLFFDTGENEMPPDFGLPRMEPDGRTWLEQYLARICEGGEVRQLGLHDAFDAEGEPAQRNLFAVVRR